MDDLSDLPLFQAVSSDGPTGKIQTAGRFGIRTVQLERRAGYEKNIEIHAIRREVLVEADGKLLRAKYLR